MNKIIVKNLSKRFQNGDELTEVFNIPNLEISGDHFTAITGASGSGKSTFLQIIAGLDEPTTGEVLIRGLSLEKDSYIDINNLNNKAKNKIRRNDLGFIYQKNFLLKDLNALDNLLITSGGKERAEFLLNKVGLYEKRNRLFNQLSGGEKQRISICRALMNKPSFVFADEPTGSLDEKNTDKIWELFQELKNDQNFGLIMVTHDSDLAEYCDVKYHMKKGILV